MLTPKEYKKVKSFGSISPPFQDTWECEKSETSLTSTNDDSFTCQSLVENHPVTTMPESNTEQISEDINTNSSYNMRSKGRKRSVSFSTDSDRKKMVKSKDFDSKPSSSTSNSKIVLKGDDDIEIQEEQMCSGKRGLLTKIVVALKKESPGSTFRFWFSRAIESYLRSANPYADQLFLLGKGLLKYLANSLLKDNPVADQKEVLQSAFDLLGELLKFNLEAHKQLDKIMAAPSKEKKLFKQVSSNIVDSNMLIRSLVLSQDYFTYEAGMAEYAKNSNTLKHVATFEQRLNFLVKLIKTISVDTLTQENVSCLNTSLVILMLAHRQLKLPLYLEGLRNYPNETQLLPNLQSLLKFWQTHYLHYKDKDCKTLQRVSHLPMFYRL